jgi:hypothetical protein
MTTSLIGIDGDTAIYRTFRAKYLLSDLRARRLTIVRPSCWDDPFENMITNYCFCYHGDDGLLKQHFFDQSRNNVFAQCWSLSVESDALWRLYSAVVKDAAGKNTDEEHEGVKVRTTPRKLLSSLTGGLSTAGFTAYVGLVQYEPDETIRYWFANEVRTGGPNTLNDPVSHAKSLLLKREPFSHEREVRLICVGDGRSPTGQTLSCAMDADLFDEVILDPRIAAADETSRTDELRKAGFHGLITRSTLYQRALVEVVCSQERRAGGS